ncbi:MAG: hypothetical protein OES37_03885 [Chromatiales bacterium]|nr:hypothetical protein [Chromatiales bacterium]
MKSIISMLTVAGLTGGLLLTQVGCADSGQEAVAANPALAAPVPEGMVRGTVLETMDSGGYTYVFVETDQDKRWIAARQSAVKVGDVVQTQQGMPMSDFKSQTLNREFDVVYFVDGLQNLSASSMPAGQPGGAMPEGHPDTGMPPGHPSVGGPDVNGAEVAEAAEITVTELTPGQDIAYVHANKDALAGQQLSLRGKVVKYNDGIMGMNWIHIQDGSGDAAEGSNDLTVTSQDATAVGDTVVVTGTVILDKDFGAGYSFPVMMEDASLTTE